MRKESDMKDRQLELPPFWRSPAGGTLLAAIAIGAFYLVSEHTAHFLGALPYLLILACPLMHIFMHRGHRHGSRSQGQQFGSGDDDQRQ
jgi:hypothetical protein